MFENALKYCKEKAIDLLTGFVPKTYSMTEECNILGLYDDTFIITKQENLVAIMSLQGLSYSNLMQKDLEGYFDTRQNVLKTISKDIQLRIVAKRRKEFINQSPNIDNPYAKAIITQFESKEIYKTEYFLVFESITSNVKSFFEKKKLKMTTSINEELEESSKENKQENENSSNETHSNTSSNKDKKNKFKKKTTFSATSKRALLIQTIERVKNALREFKPTLLNSKEVLNFYAEYINGKYIAFNPKLKRLSDSYIASNIHFKKDYFIIEFQNQSTFCACVGIKNYESEEISSLPISTLLHTQIELDLIFHIRSLGQFESLNFLKTKKKLTLSKIVKNDIDDYIELVQSNRLSMQECALNLVLGVSSTSTNGIARSDGSSGANGSNGDNGIDGTSGTSGYQGVGSNPFPPIAGSGSGSSGSSNSGYTPFMSGGGGIGGMGGGFIPFPYSPGLQNGSGANGIDGTNGVNGANGTSGANGNNSANGGAASADSHYTNEFCTAPIRNGNTMSLDIVDRNGSCFKMQAFRNDNVCQYSYDFENMKAIKQTQFYFINRENKSVNIGGCVDLYGKQFEFTMYEDANKCKLDTTTDKGYGSGSASFFQTEILFRGLDNLIHVAKSCTDFAGVQEQLVKYDNDPATRTVQRVVNQYYIDPITKQKVFISHNVVSPLKFSYQTYACGKWQFDDAKLEAYRPTQIRIFDTVANQYYNVTGCDYTSDMGKVPKIVQPYTKINVASSVKGEEVGDLDTTDGSNDNLPQYTTFEIQEMSLNSSQWTATSYCNDFWGSWTKTYGYTGYSQGNLRTLAKWVTQYKTINQGTTIEYIRPRNEGDSDAVYDTYKYYYVSQAQKTLKRIPLTIYINSLNLSDEYRKNFELTTLSQELNLNNGVKQLINTQDFTNWQATYYRPNGNGNLCMSYSFSSGSPWKSSDKGKYCSWAQTPNANYSCASHNNWIVPNQ
ncbi:hypothetical protein Taiwan2_00870 [Helicobacter pylori]